jgi:hypothetical protein
MSAIKQQAKKILAVGGTRDAVETAIDMAKDGRPWEKKTSRIALWPTAKRKIGEDCEEASEDLEK